MQAFLRYFGLFIPNILVPRGGFMQQKMILQTVKQETAPSDSHTIEKALCRGLLLAFGEAGLLTERQVRTALARLEKR